MRGAVAKVVYSTSIAAKTRLVSASGSRPHLGLALSIPLDSRRPLAGIVAYQWNARDVLHLDITADVLAELALVLVQSIVPR